MAKQAIIYCRVASGTSDTVDSALAKQEASCRRYAEEAGYSVARVFHDHAAGTTAKRPGLNDLFAHVANQKSPPVVVTEGPHRLAREPTVFAHIKDRLASRRTEILWAATDDSEAEVPARC